MADGRISITIEADDNFSTVLNRINKQLKTTGRVSKDAAKGMAGLGFSVIALNQAMELFQRFGRPLINLGKQLLETTDKFRRMEIALTSLTGSATFARESFKRLVDITRATPFTLDSMTESFVRLKSTGVRDTERVLKGIVNAVSAFGGTEQDIKLVALAFQQMAGKGVVSMEELRRQLGERVPTAMRILARELNLTLPQLFSKVEKGALDSFEAIQALTRGFEKDFSGAAERMLNTWSGATAKLTTSWQLFLSEVGKKGALDTSIGAVRNMTTALDVLANNVDKVIIAFKAWFALSVPAGGGIGTAIVDILSSGLDKFTLLVNKAAQRQKALNDMMEKEKVILDNRLIVWKTINERIEENRKRQEAANIAGLKAAGIYKLGASGLKAWNKQLIFNDPLVAAGTFQIKEQTKALEKLDEEIVTVRNATKGLSDVVEFNRLRVLAGEDAFGKYSDTLSGLSDVVEFNRLRVLLNAEAYRNQEAAILSGVDAVKAMINVERDLGRQLKETEDKLKKQKQAQRDAFFQGQAERVGGQFIGVSGAIAGGQQAGLPGAIVGALTDILLASPKMQAAIAKVNETIIRVFEPIIDALIPVLEAMQPALEELAPVLEALGKILRITLVPLITSLRFVGSVIKFWTRVVEGLVGLFKKLLDAIKILTDAIASLVKGIKKTGNIAENIARGTVTGRIATGLGFHEGGLIRQQDLLRGPGMRPDEGLILAKAGERVQTEEQQKDRSVIINVSAIDPRGSSQEIRLVVQELQAQGLL